MISDDSVHNGNNPLNSTLTDNNLRPDLPSMTSTTNETETSEPQGAVMKTNSRLLRRITGKPKRVIFYTVGKDSVIFNHVNSGPIESFSLPRSLIFVAD